MKNKVFEAIRVAGKIDNLDYFGCEQAYVTYPVVFPTVLVPLETTNELCRLAAEAQSELLEQTGDFFIGLNSFLPLKINTCIEFLDYDGMSCVIDIDSDALPEVRRVLDEQLMKYGQSVEGLLEKARKEMLS